MFSKQRDTKVTSLREISEEMGTSFSSKIKGHGIIGCWGGTTVYAGRVDGLSRTKHFQKNSETRGLVLVPLCQDFESGSHIAVLNENGDGVISVDKSNFSSFVIQRLKNDFAKVLFDLLNGNIPDFSCLSTNGDNKGAASMVLTNYKDHVNKMIIPCLYLVIENRRHKYANKINFCAGLWESKDGYINGRNHHVSKKSSRKTSKKTSIKPKSWRRVLKRRNPNCGVFGCTSCKPGQTHRCPDCGGSDHRGAAHWNKGVFTLQRGFCGVMGCTSCKPGQTHFCKICNCFTMHRACEHF